MSRVRHQQEQAPEQANERLVTRMRLFSGRTSPHAASKPGYTHLTDTAADPAAARRRAQAWSAATGRPLPPQLRAREQLPEPEPMGTADRVANYLDEHPPLGRRAMAGMLDDHRLRPAQRRRALHKAGAHGERPAGYQPEAARLEAARVLRARRARAQRQLAYWRDKPRPLTTAERRRWVAALDARVRHLDDADVALIVAGAASEAMS